jgi:hypothetical protein
MNIKQPIARTNLSFTPFIQAEEVDVRIFLIELVDKHHID